MTDENTKTTQAPGPDQGHLSGDKLDKREGVVGETSDNDPRFDDYSGDEPGEDKGKASKPSE